MGCSCTTKYKHIKEEKTSVVGPSALFVSRILLLQIRGYEILKKNILQV